MNDAEMARADADALAPIAIDNLADDLRPYYEDAVTLYGTLESPVVLLLQAICLYNDDHS